MYICKDSYTYRQWLDNINDMASWSGCCFHWLPLAVKKKRSQERLIRTALDNSPLAKVGGLSAITLAGQNELTGLYQYASPFDLTT